MSTKKKANKVEAKKTEKTIQYVGIAMIVIVVAIIAWPMLPSYCLKIKARMLCHLQASRHQLPQALRVLEAQRCWKRNCMCGI